MAERNCNTNRRKHKPGRRSLNGCAFQVGDFPDDVPDRGCWLQVQRWIMVLDCPCSFGVNLCRNDDCGQPMLIGQGINFTDAESFKNLMPLVHEFFSERVRGTVCEQDEYHQLRILRLSDLIRLARGYQSRNRLLRSRL